MLSTKKMHGMRVLGGKNGTHKIGKVDKAVFHPTEPRIVGYVVKRPDFLLMVKRRDRFLAFDSCRIVDGKLSVSESNGAFDEAALKRLDIDYGKCVLWEYMPLRTEDGHDLGRIGMVNFNGTTGEVISITTSDGVAAQALLGVCEIPIAMVIGYTSGFIVTKAAARSIGASGGIAAKAGTASAKAGNTMTEAGKKAGVVINEGAYSLGSAIGKAQVKIEQKKEEHNVPDARAAAGKVGQHLGKTKGMFAAFKEEYKKGVSSDE